MVIMKIPFNQLNLAYMMTNIPRPVHCSFQNEKNCQTNPPGTLNVFYILVIHTDNAQMSFEPIALCQPGGAAINFSKSTQNQNQRTLLL